MFSFCICHACSSFICVCMCVCLPSCWTNASEIILPQSPRLSGQSDEELVIFNTAGGCWSIREAKLRVSECRSDLTSPCVCLLCVFLFTVGSFPVAQQRWRDLFSRQCPLKKRADKLDRVNNGQTQSHRGDRADTIRLRDRSVRVLGRGQVIKADTDKVPNAPGCSLAHLFLNYILTWRQMTVLV